MQKRAFRHPFLKSTRALIALALMGMLILIAAILARPAMADVLPQSAYQQLQAAWQQAGERASYAFNSTILQTTTPTAGLANVGRGIQTQRIRMDGTLDQAAETMAMEMQVGQQQPIGVKIEDGQAYGRQGINGTWLELESMPDLFAPGGDPLGFLVAAENVRALSATEQGLDDFTMPAELSQLVVDDSTRGVTRYAFDLSGPKFARFMREQTELELHRTGELPPSLSLSSATIFAEMSGHGEMWIGADGLPIRQIIRVDFPAEADSGSQVSADIVTTFDKWAASSGSAWANFLGDPTLLLTQPAAVAGVDLQAIQQMTMTLGMLLMLLGVVALAVTHRRLRAVRAVIYSVIILSMLVTPLLQAEQVQAYAVRQEQRAAASVPAAANTSEASADAFDPHADPVRVAMADTSTVQAAPDPVASAANTTAPDSVVAVQTTATCTVTEDSDCDGDGLSDQVEIHQLGTFVDDADTDGDFINDLAEIQPFVVGGQTWYLDPRNNDSNGDGLSDSAECTYRTTLNNDGTINVEIDVSDRTCPDTDSDGVPDVYDFDNDGDGVPDNVDSSPYDGQTVTDGAFGLNLANAQSDKSIFVDFQIRPTNDRHLWWANSYLDWPDKDVQGQIQRVTDETLSDLGDMQLSPVLEIAIPFDAANPTRGLPVQDGVDVGSITASTPITTWLDMDTIAPLGISVTEPDENDGTIYAYVMLATVEDEVGETPVALGGRMAYELPSGAGDWGAEHEVRLLWLVNALVDGCEAPDGYSDDEAAAFCADTANWTSAPSVVQSYYDDFTVTGLVATEDHGAAAAVFAQKSAGQYYDADLWHLADVLQQTFLTRAVDADTNEPLRVENIDTHLSAWGVGNLYVKELSNLTNELALADALTGDEMIAIVDEARPSAAAGSIATVLFVGEQSTRHISLASGAIAFADGGFTLDFANSEVETTGSLRWTPYLRTGDSWTNADVTGEDSIAGIVGNAIVNVFTDTVLDTMSSSGAPISDYEQARQGAALLATNYYVAQLMGASVALAGPDAEPGAALNDSNYRKSGEPAVTIVSRLVAAVQRYYTQISLNDLTISTTNAGLEAVANNTWAKLADSPAAVLEAAGAILNPDSTELVFQELDFYANEHEVQEIMDVGALIVTETALDVFQYSVTGAEFAFYLPHFYKSWLAFDTFKDAIFQQKMFTHFAKTAIEYSDPPWSEAEATEIAAEYAQKQKSIKSSTLKWAKVGLAVEITLIGIEFAWTLATHHIPVDSVEFNKLIAETVAKIIWAVIQFTLISNPYTAAFFVTIALLDALIAIICTVVQAAEGESDDVTVKYLCRGITSYIIQGISLAINDTTLLMDLEKEDQFEVLFAEPSITSSGIASGYAVGNTLTLSATVNANAYAGKPNWMGYIYNWQLRDENVKETAVDFRLQGSEADFEKDLSFGDTDWQRPEVYRTVTDALGTPTNPQPGKRFETQFLLSIDHVLTEPGLNLGLSGVYFSQAVKVKKQDCWLVPNPAVFPPVIPVCQTEETFDDTFHQHLEDAFVIDVFPATLDDFHTLVQDVEGAPGMRLAWDEDFPVLMDADGDGLVSGAFNGPDPDDSNPDTDGDGLSDFYEVQNGLDATEADADCDGLTDYWEVFYNTDPNHGDTDHDGLLDSLEVFHPNIRYPYENSAFTNANAPACAVDAGLTAGYDGGWEIVYAFDGNTPLSLRVSADPNDFDSDDDGLTDRQEEVYGYSPHAPSELDVLTLETAWTSQHPDYMPYLSTINTNGGYGNFTYEATVTNDLTGRYLRGLLETEFPVDSVISTREIDILRPAESSTLTGAVNMDDLAFTSSQATSLSLRAGVIVDLPDGHLAWLRMNEAAGSSLLTDSSVFGNNGRFSNGQANGSYLYFPQCDSSVTVPSVGTLSDGYTIGVKFKMTDNGDNDRPTILVEDSQGSLLYVTFLDHVNNGTTTIAPNQWYHAAVTVTAGETRLYLDGRLEATTSGRYLGTSQRFSFGDNQCNVSLTYRDFWLDDFELFDRVLSDAELLAAYGRESLAKSLQSTGNGVSCPSGRCPTLSDAGATFDQTQHLTVDTSSLDFSDNQFSIAATVKPLSRAHPFNNAAGAHFGIDTSQDWQGVYGYQDPSNSKRIFPSLFVGSNGALRVDMGDGTDTCSYQTANGIVDFGEEQQVLVSFDGSAFTIFVNGVERATGAPTTCAAVDILDRDSIYVGRPNATSYLHFDSVHFEDFSEVTANDGEVRLNLNDDAAGGNIWSDDTITSNGGFVDRTLDKGARLTSDGDNFWFRLWEDDGAKDNAYESGDLDYSITRVNDITNIAQLATTGTDFDHGDALGRVAKGTLYWSNSNQFFRGTVNNLRIYDYAVSTQGAERVYNTETFALQMSFDEAPGESRFIDESGNYFEAECASTNCPDSGIPGRHNQAARFDGGVADDDGNDGVADFLTLTADATALGLDDDAYTLMAWVKPDWAANGKSYNPAVMALRSTAATSFSIHLRADLSALDVYNGSKVAAFPHTFATNEWVHIAVSMANGAWTAYVNGADIGTVSAPPGASSGLPFHIGSSTGSAEFFDGLIDDLRILTYAADAAAVQRMMNEAPLLNLHLDEDVNTTAFANDSLNGGDATCAGTACPGAGDKGQLRESAAFDGIDDTLVVNGTEALELNTYTVALWVKPTQKKSLWQPLIYKGSANSGQRMFALLLNTESMTVRHNLQASDCSTYVIRDSDGTLLLNQWNHVVMTFDGAQNALYINGALDGTVAYEGTPCQMNHPVRLAYATASTLAAFAGNLDEITIENGARSAAQVQELYLYQSAWYDEKQQHTILVDADFPTSSVVLGSDYVQPGQILLIDAQDPVVNGVASGIHSAAYRIDGGDWVYVDPDNDGLYFVPATATATLADGAHTIQTRATDRTAHRAEGPVQTFQIDTVAPRVGAVDYSSNLIHGLPTNITTLPNGTFTWGITAYDDQGTVQSGIDESSIQATVKDRNGTIVNGPVGVTWRNGWEATFAFESQPYGLYTVHADAQDMAGNASSGSGLLALDGLPGYGDLLIDTNIITGTDAVINGLASDIPYPEGGRTLHLHFEEADGATLFHDGSVNHFNATCAEPSCPSPATTDKFDRAARFDGGDALLVADQGDVAAATALGLNGDFTVMAWVKPDALSGTQQILAAEQTNSAGGISFGLNGDMLELQAYGAQLYQSAVATGLATGAWSHVAAKYSASDTTVSFYVNGELLETVTGTTDLLVNTDDPYRIGQGFSGFIDELAVYATNLSDERLYNIANPVWNFPGLVRVRYRHAAGSVWPHLDPDGVALYLPLDEVVNAEEFEDLSTHNRHATCSGDLCPLAGDLVFPSGNSLHTGGYGNTTSFDGVDDFLTVPHVLNPAATGFSAGVRFQTTVRGKDQYILQQTDGAGTGRTWLVLTADGTLRTFLGGQALDHPTPVSTNEWHHAAVTYDLPSQTLTLYLDGVPVSTTRTLEASDGEMLVGVSKSSIGFFDGFIDEVAVFDRAFTDTEVGYLMAEPWYLAFYDVDALPVSPNLFSPWQHTVPTGLEGPHKIDLLVAETATYYRAGVSHAVWTGEIDTTPPRVALDYTLSADKSSVTIACAAADYNLSEEGWECPVDDANRARHYKDAAWFTTIFSDTQKLAGFTTADEIFTPGPDLHVTACDLWNNCTTLAPDDTDGDGIPDHVEGEGDRDGDGILDAHDYDPDGHFYELGSGRIIPGGTISVSGPGQISLDPDGNTGYYDWTTDGTPGLYVMTVTPPAEYILSPDCPPQPDPIDPVGDAPVFLGSFEIADTATLADGSCAANPYYLQFDIREGAPFVFNNNIPLTFTGPTAIDGGDEPLPPTVALDHAVFLPLVAQDAALSFDIVTNITVEATVEQTTAEETPAAPVSEDESQAPVTPPASETPEPTPVPGEDLQPAAPSDDAQAATLDESASEETVEAEVTDDGLATPEDEAEDTGKLLQIDGEQPSAQEPRPTLEPATGNADGETVDAPDAGIERDNVGSDNDVTDDAHSEEVKTGDTEVEGVEEQPPAEAGNAHRILLPFVLN